ncbi:MAG TPA: hypothetical protein VFQ38_20180 [Longimicrobiales bacterium]|nr:hypothetical protein [Longimicrobiales bacterium]
MPRIALALLVAALAACDATGTGPGGPDTPSPGSTFAHVSAGATHTCGVLTGGAAVCWGIGQSGELGTSTTASESVAVAVTGGLTFDRVSAGTSFTCGVTTGGDTFCWGAGSSGQLGDGTTTASRSFPVRILSTPTMKRVSAGVATACGVTTDNELFCWGANTVGQRGTPGSTGGAPTPVLGDFTLVDVGGNHACAISTSDDAAKCWGSNSFGELGTGASPLNQNSPQLVTGGRDFRDITVGTANFTCATTTDSDTFCWGRNDSGQLGNGSIRNSTTPVQILGARDFVQIDAGGAHACGITSDGQAFCWGRNTAGQLGDGTTTDRNTPVAVSASLDFKEISAGEQHTCAVTTGGDVWCWGANNGRLGNGSTAGSAVPVRVLVR